MTDRDRAPGAPVQATAVTAAVFAMLFWASAVVIGRGIHDVIPPIGLSFWRTVLAVLVLAPFTISHLRRDWPALRARWKTVFLMGTAMWAVGNTSLFLGLHHTTAINAGLVNAAQPAIIALLAWALFRDGLSSRQGVGIAISFVGVMVLIVGGRNVDITMLEPHRGDLLVLLAVVSWSLYVLLIRRVGHAVHPLSLLISVMFMGGLQLLPMALLEAYYVRPVPLDATVIGTVLYLTLVASIGAVICWNRAILGLGHTRAGLFTHLMPVFSVVLAVLILGERPQLMHWIGTLVIVIGLCVSTPGKVTERQAAQSADARP